MSGSCKATITPAKVGYWIEVSVGMIDVGAFPWAPTYRLAERLARWSIRQERRLQEREARATTIEVPE